MSIMDQIKFNYFLKKVRKTEDYELIISYVRKHRNLSNNKLFSLTKLLCDSKEECYLLEFVKASEMIETNICCLNKIAQTLYLTDGSYFISEFITMFPNLRLSGKLIHRLCELKSIDRLFIYLDNKSISSASKQEIISTIIKDGSIKHVEILVQNHYDILSIEERKSITTRVCSSLHPYSICLISSLFIEDDKQTFVEAICKTKYVEFLYNFLEKNRNLKEEQIKDVVFKICDYNDIEYIYRCLLLLDGSYSALRKMLMQKIKESGNLKYMMFMTVYSDKEYLLKNFDFIQKIYEKAIMTEDIFTDAELVDIYRYMQKTKSENLQLVKK